MLNEINHMSREFVDVTFHFKNREYNSEAHSLAKAASSLHVSHHLWLGNVPDITCIRRVLNFE